MQRRHAVRWFVALMSIVNVLSLGCHDSPNEPSVDDASNSESAAVLRLATTTSTRDSGLLEVLLPVFEKTHNCRVDVIAVGTGAALKLGETGEADALLVHARQAELAFMAAGHGSRREEFMMNYFTILGPAGDPAKLRDTDAADALQRIAEAELRFISRGDQSGTHSRELKLWEHGGGRPSWDGYLESGQGMGPSLFMADEMGAYILSDMGTYLRFKEKIDLRPLTRSSDGLRNPYAAIVVDGKKDARIHPQLANQFVDFLLAPETQHRIDDYRLSEQQLFLSSRLESDP